MIVYNLSTDEEINFDHDIPAIGVAYAYAHQHGLMSKWSELVHKDHVAIDNFKQAGFPMIVGSVSLGCGEWVTRF